MKSHASVLAGALLVAATSAAAQDQVPGDGPRGSSQVRPGETRYDAVGPIAVVDTSGLIAVSAALPSASFAEVTSLENGRTIVVAVDRGVPMAGTIVSLSSGAATALGIVDPARAAVRVRSAVIDPRDGAGLRSGTPAAERPDAPPALLAALRRKVASPAVRPATPPARRPARPVEAVTRTPTPSTPRPLLKSRATLPVLRGGYVVQVAALSSASRAAAAASAVGGHVVAGPPLWRVRLGPFADQPSAARAKAAVARRGYPAAQILRYP